MEKDIKNLFQCALGANEYSYYSGRVTLTVLMKKTCMSDADIKNQMGWTKQSTMDQNYYRDIASAMSDADFNLFKEKIRLKSAFLKELPTPSGFLISEESLRPQAKKRNVNKVNI